nr:putative j domain-containing protein c4h3.01 [Quercus suber]
MATPLPSDPYLALGVAKDADASAIKTQYRKLALKFHPDKVKDETQKKPAADEFHKIQTAYEIIGDEDRRQRYDAQVKLSELRRDVISKGGSEGKTSAYKSSSSSAYYGRGFDRVSPTYEERKPSYAAQDYFDQTAIPTPRKEREDPYERTARYESSRDDYEKARTTQKSTKDTERISRKEKSKRVDKDIKRERDRKPAPARVEIVSEPSSSEDEYDRAARRRAPGGRDRWEEDSKRVKEQFWAQAQRQKEEADRGVYTDERTRKMFSQHAEAFNAIRSGGKRQEQARRPSPSRTTSSKENWKNAFAKVRAAERPEMSRRESTRSRLSTRDKDSQARRPSTREYDRRTSDDLTDEPRESRKPGLYTAKSSPLDIRTTAEKPRAQSVQIEKDDLPQPQMKRAETMPMQSSADRERDRDVRKSKDSRVPPRSSGLRQAEFPEVTPAPSVNPEYSASTQDPSTYYRYHSQYADDDEYPTPDGYKTAQVKPKKVTRSPSPLRERERETREVRPQSRDFREPRDPIREKGRTASSRYAQQAVPPPMPTRTTSTSYVYNDGRNVDSYTRPVLSRGDSGRSEYLYGEMPREKVVPQSRSPKLSSKYSPPLEPEYRPSTAQYRSGLVDDTQSRPSYTYSRRPSEVKPSYTRTSSRTQQPIYAR